MKTKLFAMVGATFAFMLLPFASMAAQNVKIDSSLNVANVTAGGTTYTKSVNAKVDDVVKLEVYIHNTQLPDSGLVANNLKAKVTIPTTPGKAQTVSSTVSGDNTNTVSDTATVNLSLDNASLQYIPGSAKWTHNTGTNTNVTYTTTPVSDTVVTTGATLGDQKPCFNFESYVTLEARVVAPVVGITKTVKVDGSTAAFAASNTANPGQTLDYALVVKNYGNTTLQKVVVGDNLPPYLTYVKGSTKLVDSNTGTAGKMLVDGITTGGVYVDDMAPGASETIYLKATLDKTIPCGDHPLKNVGVVAAQGLQQVYNVATTDVNIGCGSTPPPSTPPTQPNLPSTGAETGLAGIGGISTLAYASRAYLRSKKSLVDALRK